MLPQTADNRSGAAIAAPGPKGHFLWGVLPEMRRDRLGSLFQYARQYGPVIHLRAGPMTIYLVTHPEGIQRVLQENNHNYTKRTPLFKDIRRILGNGLFVSEGDYWRRQRRLMQPAFHRQHIAGFGDMMTGATQAMLERWQAYEPDAQPVNMFSEMMRLTLDIVCKALFTVNIEQHVKAIEKSVSVLVEDVIFRFDNPFYPVPPFPTRRNRGYQQAVGILDRIVYSIIADRRQNPRESADLLAMLLEARAEDTGEAMTDQQLRDEIITLLIAGHETTATTLAWAWYLLAANPEVEERWRLELAQTLGGRTPTLADLADLPTNRSIIDETLRLYPAAWVTHRHAEAEDEVCGVRIPAGSEVAVSPYITQHLPEFWDDPEAFDPQRFTPQRSEGRPRYAYLPFGGGPRQCIGNNFALLEAQIVLAMVGQRYRLSLVPGRTVEPLPLVTLRPRGGVWMTISSNLK